MDGILQIAQGSSMSVLDEDKQNIILDAMELMKERNIVSGRDEVQEHLFLPKNWWKPSADGCRRKQQTWQKRKKQRPRV